MKHFDSIGSYFRFVLAKDFLHKDTLAPVHYRKNFLERLGGKLAGPLLKPGDILLKNIRNPLLITALVVVSIALTTLVFYPGVYAAIVPMAKVVRFSLFCITQTTILGLGLRALGRLRDDVLMDHWIKREIVPLGIGSTVVMEKRV